MYQQRCSPAKADLYEHINTQHRRLHVLCREYESALRTVAVDDPVVQDILDELLAVVEDHFRCEEELMVSIGYPNALTHCCQHEDLSAELHRLRHSIKNGTSPDPTEVVRRIRAFGIEHMHDIDSLYVPRWTPENRSEDPLL